VADHFDLTHFRKAFDVLAGELATQCHGRIDGRNVKRRNFHSTLTGRRFFEDQPFILDYVLGRFANDRGGRFV
jgi:hypothetical protein